MGPRKKLKYSSTPSSSSKNKSNSNQLPAKYGIQHFFQRHSQNTSPSQTHKKSLLLPSHNPNVPEPVDATTIVAPKHPDENPPLKPSDSIAVPTVHPNASNGSGSRIDDENLDVPLQNRMPGKVNAAEENPAFVSPENSKSVPLRRFRFSPGSLIMQSQDDGGDEITWKVSPVNERLQAISKHVSKDVKVLAESSKINSSTMRPCSLNKASHKVDKKDSSLTPEGTEAPLVSANRVGLKSINPLQDMTINGGMINVKNSSTQQSPFRTPPSLPYCQERFTNGVECNGALDQLSLRVQKKTLLELLDQVEDVISAEESVSSGNMECSPAFKHINGNEISQKAGSLVQREAPEKIKESASNHNFLVLEVSEKHKSGDRGGEFPYKSLRLLNEQSGEERCVCLLEEWFYSVIEPGDTVNVIGEFDDQGKCEVGRDCNLLIIHPDILISGTRVTSSFSCPRRTVLDERLKCNEHSYVALLGILLHQIYEAALTSENPTISSLEGYARTVLQKNIESLYACGVNENDVLKDLVEAIPRILNWLMQFKSSQDSKGQTVDFGSHDGLKKLKISEVIDIEDMAWAPKYGLKGMVDASIRVKVESTGDDTVEKIVPLEFKSGKVPKGQSSMEHSAQVILYTLLMSERYMRHIDFGILHYLWSDQTQGIMARRSDLVGLIMRRNEVANHIINASKMQKLPPMLRSPNMCRSCRHLDVCTIYHKVHGGNTESSGLGDVFDLSVKHLTSAHGVFLRHWDWLIDLEAKEAQIKKNQIWHSHSLNSKHPTSCLSTVVLDASYGFPHQKSLKDDRFIYRFVPQMLPSQNPGASDGDSMNHFDLTLKIGDYVILSIESGHRTVASGIITDISQLHVSVSFSKRLRIPGSSCLSEKADLLQEVWRIDKDESMTSFSVMRFNLVQLFVQSEQGSHLRRMIVDLEAPRFESGCVFSQDPAISYIRSVKSLNGDQRRAILKILAAKDYALILGMPGTGKTSTIVHAVRALLLRGASIMLTSYTNSAVDNLLIKLKAQGIDFLRIGRQEAVHEQVRANCFSAMDVQSVEEIKYRLEEAKVVGVTCSGVTSPLLSKKRFDVCIVDEAGQITLPISLGPLMFTTKFVLVGDHYQLPPLVQSTEARENGMGISLFCRLSEAHPQAISALQNQYRMCEGIMELSNALIYGDRLRCGSSEIANAKLNFSTSESSSSWLKEVLNPSRSIVFINTDMLPAFEAKSSKAVNNPIEARIIAEVTKELVKCGIEGEEIGIITPYNSQANLIQTAVCITSVEIHTIDKYQGRDKDCILVSFVRSTENPRNCNSSLLGDWHRINVALTRAKKKLIMVGSRKTLNNVPLLKLLMEKVDEQSGILDLSPQDISIHNNKTDDAIPTH
ncbi:DNA replication ATP-dependent helicase/nuclease JHS1 [Euphorbia lathyris]|uniref:DNA replication ATP-dependent helicase/nuclease JHS1 n=1 Tax=Euphorbia lathyris TaxID=212925 RepID=UPI0033133EC6